MKTLYTFFVCFLLISCSSTNSKNHEDRQKPVSDLGPTLLQLYDGPSLPKEQSVRVLAEETSTHYLYFISANGIKIQTKSLLNGPRELALKPGSHSLQMRFVAPNQLAIPLKAFPPTPFKAGKTYIVKSNFVLGKGDYITSAKNTKITLWIEELGVPKKMSQMTLNGFGK